MNTKNLLALSLFVGTMMFQAGLTSSPVLHAQEPVRYLNPPVMNRQRETPQPEQKTPVPPPQHPAQASPELPPPPPSPEYRDWMPMHYHMPMHYRMLEPEMIYGYQLMTAKERVEYLRRLHSERSFEERDRLRMEHHRLMQERARRRHVLLPDMTPSEPR